MPIPAASITATPWTVPDTDRSAPTIRMPAPLYSRLLRRAQDLKPREDVHKYLEQVERLAKSR